ncbi:hypothetical protein F5141DRAFT_1291085 [Pisolithus sp. B1]|nr:hypothetical protein F5141DRAFT_1291085 [Pisolithus sp. B1]
MYLSTGYLLVLAVVAALVATPTNASRSSTAFSHARRSLLRNRQANGVLGGLGGTVDSLGGDVGGVVDGLGSQLGLIPPSPSATTTAATSETPTSSPSTPPQSTAAATTSAAQATTSGCKWLVRLGSGSWLPSFVGNTYPGIL